ncbi:heterogeneous nuclear ribonucleoprotein 1-like [Iris pallida]|uniref:Heterogeneous nuclear ribonucleoprotein 1-like n=1 Tax=Iris pallida TaxID=29817 RepID=A0AAX6G1S7_IRIPA|nr:heterogeneous nuclear ribonucleoprotein 1-like [Iris pallida]KAJ6840946.1 heterogeneous nuclear ribonucleoprotein 1-like [Iris pallida]
MDSDQGKLFIGGISWETTEEKLKEYFGSYGDVLQAVIMTDKITGRPRGFGFVVFADPAVLDRVLQDKHTIDGRTVEAKRALSREEQHTSGRSGTSGSGRIGGGGGGGGGNIRTKKIFVGGLPATLTEVEFRQYFQNYGEVTDMVVMYDQNTQRPRGFGFISFDTEDAVDRVLQKTFHELNGKMVEVKRALPKDANTNPGGGGGRSAGGGSYQSYSGGSGANSNAYDGRMDANRYMQPQGAGGGYPPYGSGYGAPNYGYGATNNVAGYGGYGVGSYGGSAGGYSGPSGPYGNPSAPNAGYVSDPPGAPRSSWNNQAPTGYGSSGYGGSAYGANPTWNAQSGGSSGSVTPGAGQSQGGSTGYGNQGYGYGGYGGAEGSYGNQGGYGSVGGRGGGAPAGGPGEQGAGSGYMSGGGGGYGDANGNSGYSNAWRSEPSQSGQVSGAPGGPAAYGGSGYGGAQNRQAQQQ